MAEYEEAAAVAEAAAETPAPEVAAAPSGWTEDDLAGLFDTRLAEALETFGQRLYGGLDQRFRDVEARAARIDEIDGVKQLIQDVMGETKLARAMVQRALRGELTEDDAAALEKAHQNQVEMARKDAEMARLKAALEARRPDPAQVQRAERGMNPEEVLAYEYNRYYAPMAARIAKSQGLEFDDLRADLPKIRPGATERDWNRWIDQVQALADGLADKKLKAERPRVEVPDARPMPVVHESYRDRLRKDGPLPSAAEIDRDVAAWLARNAS